MNWPWDNEKDDERFAETLNDGVSALSDRATLIRFLALSGGVVVLIWIAVLFAPTDVRSAFATIHGLNNKMSVAILAIVFGLGMWLTYCFFRLKFPTIEETDLESDVLGSYAYQASSNRRWLVWLFSAVGGIVNLLAMAVVTIALSGSTE